MHYSSVAKVCALSMGVIVLSTTLAYFILAWTNPTAQAPNGNTEAPINVSSSDQSKTGSLSIGTGLNYWITKNGKQDLMKNIPITVEEIERLMKKS